MTSVEMNHVKFASVLYYVIYEYDFHVTTLHGRLDIPDLVPLYQRFNDVPVISISDAQRVPLPWANWQVTVYHGLPEDLFRFYSDGGD